MKEEILQNKYIAYTAALKRMKKDLKEVEKEADELGYYFNNGVLTKNEKMLIAFWDGSFYSHFDGHTSDAIYDEFSGSQILKKGDINLFHDMHLELSNGMSFKDYMNRIEEFYDVDIPWQQLDTIYERPDRFIITVTDDLLRFEYKGKSDQSELVNGTYFEIRMAFKTEMIRCKEKEVRG